MFLVAVGVVLDGRGQLRGHCPRSRARSRWRRRTRPTLRRSSDCCQLSSNSGSEKIRLIVSQFLFLEPILRPWFTSVILLRPLQQTRNCHMEDILQSSIRVKVILKELCTFTNAQQNEVV
jgi:hypothetical protein